jgi:hypothetical protein
MTNSEERPVKTCPLKAGSHGINTNCTSQCEWYGCIEGDVFGCVMWTLAIGIDRLKHQLGVG